MDNISPYTKVENMQIIRQKSIKIMLISFLFLFSITNVFAGQDKPKGAEFQSDELIKAGQNFFGGASANIASVIENMFSQLGKPTAYIIGEEGSAAFFIGARYGEGYIYFRDGTRYKIYWQGPSIGADVGGDASKTMVLVYNVNSPNQLIERFPGIDGSAYIIGGMGITYQQNGNIVLGVIRTGVGARFGINIGYLKYSAEPDWNPF